MGSAIPQERGTASNRYAVLGRLASGGMADIFLVRASADAGVDRYMVLKRVLAARARDPVFAQLFLDEARLAAQLTHPNIAQVYDVGKLGGSYFFSMEYVHGEDLRVILKHCAGKKQPIPFNIAVYVATSALAALHHAHERTTSEGAPLGIVHRDVSPSNIMASYEGGIKMIDFGVAKAAQRTTTTNGGGLKGKFGYMSPEQIKGSDGVDRRSDVFSLGIVLHEMLTCKRLYKRENDFMSMSAVVNEPVPPPSNLRPDVPEDLERIVMTALAHDPDKRYPTAAAMLEDLEALATAERYLLSPTAMGRFMRDQFGAKPEPWHVLRDQVGEQLTVSSESLQAEDGTMTELPIEIGEGDLLDAELAEAPLLRQQTDPAYNTPTPVADALSSPTNIPLEPSSFTPHPSSSSFTPGPSSAGGTPAPTAKRQRAIVIVAVASLVLLGGIGALVLGGGGDGDSSAGTRQAPEAAQAAGPLPAPTPPAVAPQPPAAAPVPAPTTLEITISGVKDAVVRIDGSERGRGSGVKLDLDPGPHEVVVEAAGRPPVSKHVELGAGRATLLEIVVPLAAPVQRPRPKPAKPVKDPCSDRDYVKANPLKCQ